MKAQKQFNTSYIWKISLTAAMGGLLFGYDWIVIGGAKPFYEKFFHLTSSVQYHGGQLCCTDRCCS